MATNIILHISSPHHADKVAPYWKLLTGLYEFYSCLSQTVLDNTLLRLMESANLRVIAKVSMPFLKSKSGETST